jgi:hypothetical protein
VLPKPGVNLTFPVLDAQVENDPTSAEGFTSTANGQNGIVVTVPDIPGLGGQPPAVFSLVDKLDVKYKFRIYLVVRYTDGSIYPIAYWDWNVNFFATTNIPNSGVGAIDPASKVATDGGWYRSNFDPGKTSGPIMNGNFTWQ